MNIPNTVKIDGMEYEVIKTDETLTNDNRVCKGIIEYEYRKIKLNTLCQDEQGMKRTLLHEIIHGIVRERNFDFKAEEEFVVDELAKGFYNLINDNPEMLSDETAPCNIDNAEPKINENIKDQCDYCEYSFPGVDLMYGNLIAEFNSQCGIKEGTIFISGNESLEDAIKKYDICYCNKCGRKVKIIEPSQEIKDKIDEYRDSLKEKKYKEPHVED